MMGNESRKRLIKVLEKIIADEINLIEGARIIVSLRVRVNLDDSNLFHFFIAIDSETDHFPLGKVRQNWNKEALSKMDAEMDQYILKTINEAKKVCLELLGELYKNGEK